MMAAMALTDPLRNPLGTVRRQPPTFFYRLARGWAVVGSLMVVFATAMAVAHYAYDVPMYDKNTGRVIAPGLAALIFSALEIGGLFFAVDGFIALRALRSRSTNDS